MVPITINNIAASREGVSNPALVPNPRNINPTSPRGIIPKPTTNLFTIAELRLKARLLGIIRIDMRPDKGTIEFSKSTKVKAETLIERIKNEPETWKLISGNKLQVTLNVANLSERQDFVRTLLNELILENQLIDQS